MFATMHKEQKEERASVSLRISKKIQQMIPLFRGCEFQRYTEVHEEDEASHGSSCVGVQGSIKGQNFGMKGYIYQGGDGTTGEYEEDEKVCWILS